MKKRILEKPSVPFLPLIAGLGAALLFTILTFFISLIGSGAEIAPELQTAIARVLLTMVSFSFCRYVAAKSRGTGLISAGICCGCMLLILLLLGLTAGKGETGIGLPMLYSALGVLLGSLAAMLLPFHKRGHRSRKRH